MKARRCPFVVACVCFCCVSLTTCEHACLVYICISRPTGESSRYASRVPRAFYFPHGCELVRRSRTAKKKKMKEEHKRRQANPFTGEGGPERRWAWADEIKPGEDGWFAGSTWPCVFWLLPLCPASAGDKPTHHAARGRVGKTSFVGDGRRRGAGACFNFVLARLSCVLG